MSDKDIMYGPGNDNYGRDTKEIQERKLKELGESLKDMSAEDKLLIERGLVRILQDDVGRLQAELTQARAEIDRLKDEHHTMQELYMHRHALFAALCACHPIGSWKSKLHNDGTMYDGWFIAGIRLYTGDISYHLPIDLWDRLSTESVFEKAPAWDGYTPDDVVNRLLRLACPFYEKTGEPK